MKKLFPLFAVFCMFILWGCPEKEPVESDVITPIQTSFNIDAAGGDISVKFNTNVTCTAKSDAGWLTVVTKATKATHEESITLRAAANNDSEPRTAHVTISGGSVKAEVTVTQSGKKTDPVPPDPEDPEDPPQEDDVLVNIGGSTYNIPYAGGSFTVKVRSNVEYTVECGAEWIHKTTTKTPTEDNVNFSVDENSGDSRSAEVSFSYGDLTFTVTVNQAPYIPPTEEDPYLELASHELSIDEYGGELSVAVNANYEYDVKCTVDWINIKRIGEYFVCSVTANPDAFERRTQIRFSLDDIVEYLTIIQSAQGSGIDPFDVGSNLSVNGTANCYVVTKAGNYTFDASVMGNGTDGFIWEGEEAAEQNLWPWESISVMFKYYGNSEKPVSAEVLWDDHSVVSNVSMSNDFVISFTATGNKGNAVIGVRNKMNEILWSWHIWCTDSPERFMHETIDGTKIVMLDRNLGATSCNPSDGEATYGYWYQFGRKDPLKLFQYVALYMAEGEQTVLTSIQNPSKIFRFYGRDNEWFNGDPKTITADLWGNPRYLHNGTAHPQAALMSELRKTIYDPCPPGYMVPPEWAWDSFSLDDCTPVANGLYLTEMNGTNFYPFAGFGDQGDFYGGDNGWYGYPGYVPNSDGYEYHHNIRNVVCCWSSGTEYSFPRSQVDWDNSNYYDSVMFMYMQDEEASHNQVMVNENSAVHLYNQYAHVRHRCCSVRCMKIQ